MGQRSLTCASMHSLGNNNKKKNSKQAVSFPINFKLS